VVPAEVLCDPRILDSGEQPDCKTMTTYFRITDRTLLVADDRPGLEANLAEGVAEIVCIYNDLVACFRPALVDAVKQAGP
jgi:hypothetical protein